MFYLDKQQLIDRHYINDIDDLKRIQRALFMFAKVFVTLDEAAMLWQNYSSSVAASWIFLPDGDHEIVKYIESDPSFDKFGHDIEL